MVFSHNGILNSNENEWAQLWAVTWINPSYIILKGKSKQALGGYVWADQVQKTIIILMKNQHRIQEGEYLWAETGNLKREECISKWKIFVRF